MKAKYKIIDRYNRDWSKEFSSKKECLEWVLEGMRSCDGAERDHYVDMLMELQTGATTLHYN